MTWGGSIAAVLIGCNGFLLTATAIHSTAAGTPRGVSRGHFYAWFPEDNPPASGCGGLCCFGPKWSRRQSGGGKERREWSWRAVVASSSRPLSLLCSAGVDGEAEAVASRVVGVSSFLSPSNRGRRYHFVISLKRFLE